jgi:hypothetical protein
VPTDTVLAGATGPAGEPLNVTVAPLFAAIPAESVVTLMGNVQALAMAGTRIIAINKNSFLIIVLSL